MRLCVFTDGASRGNPGPAAIGVAIETENGVEIAAFGKSIGRATNNVAEYRAAIEGVRRAKELGADAVELYVDSELLARQLSGAYRVRNPKLRPLYEELVKEVQGLREFSVQHVPREQNRRADQLAKAATLRSSAAARETRTRPRKRERPEDL